MTNIYLFETINSPPCAKSTKHYFISLFLPFALFLTKKSIIKHKRNKKGNKMIVLILPVQFLPQLFHCVSTHKRSMPGVSLKSLFLKQNFLFAFQVYFVLLCIYLLIRKKLQEWC